MSFTVHVIDQIKL